jgi:hypothetical protein
MKTSEFKSFILDYTKINESAQRVLHGSTFRMPRFEVSTIKRGEDDAVRVFHSGLTLPEDSEYDDVFVVRFISDLGEVVAQTHDPIKFRKILTVISETFGPDSPRVFWKNLEEALDVSGWAPKDIEANHWKATILTCFFAEALAWYYPENRDQSENYFWKVEEENENHRYVVKTVTGIVLTNTTPEPKEWLGYYKNWNEIYLTDFYKLYILHLSRFLYSNDYDTYASRLLEWVLKYSYINSIDVNVPGIVIVPVTGLRFGPFDRVTIKGVKLWVTPHRKKKNYGSVDFNSIRSLSWFKKNHSEDYEYIEDYYRKNKEKINILSIRVGNDSYSDLEWNEKGDTIIDRFNEVNNPTLQVAADTTDWKVISMDTNFFLSRNGNGIDRTFYGAVKREEGSMFLQISNLTWDLHGAFFKGTDLLSILIGNKILSDEELESHVFSEKDFDGKSSGALRYYGDYSDYHFTVIDMEPCLWFDDGKTETNHLDEWPYVESFHGRPTKEVNAAVIYAEIKVQEMIEKEFPTLMKDHSPKKNGFWLNIKALLGRNTDQAVEYVRNQVRHYVLRLEVFDLLEELFTNSGHHQRSEYREWSRSLKGEEVPYEGDKWPHFMWNCYQKWGDKYKSLLKVKEALLSLRKRIQAIEKDPEKRVPENLPKYIEVPYTKELFAPSWKTVSPFADVVLSVINYDGDKEQQPEDSTLKFEVRSPKLIYTLLGFYNESQGRGRNWRDFVRTVRSVCHLDDCRFLFLRNYDRDSSLDYRRLSLYANKENIKISFKGDTLRIDPATATK